MPGGTAVLSPDLQALLETLSAELWDANIAGKLNQLLADSEGRFDLFARDTDFGGVVRHRRVKPALRDKTGEPISAASTRGPLPVKSGRFVAGWNWRVKGINATVINQVPYAIHARKLGKEPGQGYETVKEWIEEDWGEVAEAMADVIAREIG